MADDTQSDASSNGSNGFANLRPHDQEHVIHEEPEVNPDQQTPPGPTKKPSTRGGKQPTHSRGGK